MEKNCKDYNVKNHKDKKIYLLWSKDRWLRRYKNKLHKSKNNKCKLQSKKRKEGKKHRENYKHWKHYHSREHKDKKNIKIIITTNIKAKYQDSKNMNNNINKKRNNMNNKWRAN